MAEFKMKVLDLSLLLIDLRKTFCYLKVHTSTILVRTR
jgi:hypothetical protein